MAERRWPYLSTQAPVSRTNPPDFNRAHKEAPAYETTELFKSRLAKKKQDEAELERRRKTEKTKEELRQQQQKRATAEVAGRLKELTGDPRNLKKAQKAKAEELKQQIRENNADQRRRAKEWIDEINQKVADRRNKVGFLFEQASVDAAVERAKQDAHDKFDKALRKSGLADMLDPPVAP
mmetsp:Transcript_29150/g.75033  ORF Transcript_29150/g.75033 Transcript_29150/m.75033 type:complete len:180 (-) Transcript_29150:561-1100(-)